MAQFEGGYTSAVNSSATRDYQRKEMQLAVLGHIARMAQQQRQNSLVDQELARQHQSEEDAATGLPLLARRPQGGGLPMPPGNQPMGPQAPNPGQASMPAQRGPQMSMMPQQNGGFMPPPPQMSVAPQPAQPQQPMPAAMMTADQIPPYEPMPTEAPQPLGGASPQGIAPPPQMGGAPSIEDVAAGLEKQGITGGRLWRALNQLAPRMDANFKQELQLLNAQVAQYRDQLAHSDRELARVDRRNSETQRSQDRADALDQRAYDNAQNRANQLLIAQMVAATSAAGREKKDPKSLAAYNAGLKELGKEETSLANIAQVETALKRWAELNASVETGRISGLRPAIGQPQFQELAQLENYLAANNFKPGQGQISNFERQMIKGAGPSTKNDRATNQQIVKVQLGAVENVRDKSAFKEAYLDSTGKLLGADKIWNEYIEKNPRYISGQGGEIIDNPARKNWQDYFSAAFNSTGTTAAPSGAAAGPKIGEKRVINGRSAKWDGKGWLADN